MATPLIMPKQGQSVESCVIVSWKKQVGDAVKAGEILCDVETDKATFEVESPASGTLLAIFHPAGSDVPVLTPIAAIGKPGESIDALRGPSAGHAGASAPDVGAAPTAASSTSSRSAASTAPSAMTTGKIMASPRAKALAGARGVSLVGLHGTGPGGRIIERDVTAAAGLGQKQPAATRPAAVNGGAAQSAARPEPAPAGEFKEIRVTGIRKLIAERMLASLQTTAQLTLHCSADARALLDLRRKLKESPETLGLRTVTINDLVLFAVTRALLQHPDVNALYIGETLRQYAVVHLAFAVDTPRGLMVPVIRDAHSLSLREIARESGRLITGCLEGGITPDELAGGTFTVTNLGSLGVQAFTPVLNVPQCAILGVGAIGPGPVMASDGSMELRPQIGLSLTVNHQVVDGAPGARFLQTLSKGIASIDLLLAR
jgi:pyruvate dehydrogenase E2 component (dihydrolipoamide acetyltransferase)